MNTTTNTTTQGTNAPFALRVLSTLVAATLILAIVPVVGATPAQASTNASAEQQYVNLINQERAAHGLASLSVATDVRAVARDWSTHMASTGNFVHNPNFIAQVGGVRATENISMRWSTSKSMDSKIRDSHQGLMNSPGHRANILDPNVSQVGVGVWYGEIDGVPHLYVTQNFRQPAGASSDSDDTEQNSEAPSSSEPDETPSQEESTAPTGPSDSTPAQRAPRSSTSNSAPQTDRAQGGPGTAERAPESEPEPVVIEAPDSGPLTRAELAVLLDTELGTNLAETESSHHDRAASRMDLALLLDRWTDTSTDAATITSAYFEGIGRTDSSGRHVRISSLDVIGSLGGPSGAPTSVEEVRAVLALLETPHIRAAYAAAVAPAHEPLEVSDDR